jgi:alpha-glucosidase (family GH31 glycosyl hydrolase)
MSYVNTFLADVSSKASGFKRNLFAEATDDHYLVWNTTSDNATIISSGPGIEAGILDITSPDTRDWFTQVLSDQVWNVNISGFMADFGEYTPITSDTSLENADPDALFYHSKYPGDWAAFHRSVVEELDLTSEAVLFHRSASMSSNRNMNLFWVGDQDIDWGVNDGIKSAVTIMGHMGISGYSQSHSDIGGYTTTFGYPTDDNPTGINGRTAELLGRWGELAAVSSTVYRSHEGNVPSYSAQPYTNHSTYSYFAYSARLFASLAPYRRQILDSEASKLGWPLLRMPVLYHTQDPIARNISYQSFYLGPDLYVAPVLDPGQTSVEVYLPNAKDQSNSSATASYTHVWSGETYDGGQTVTVPAPYGQPAVFVVDNATSSELNVFLDFVSKEKDTVIDLS